MKVSIRMTQAIHPTLRAYIESEILPRYNQFDAAHQLDHALTVIEQSLILAQFYDVNENMVYTIAAYHDTGLTEGREIHQLVSGKIIRNDKRLREFFTEEEIEIMAEAVEDHRASSNHTPRSIYGKIVAEADRLIDGPTIVRRTIQYGLSHYPELKKEEHFKRFLHHMKEKYAEGGYLKLWIPESANASRLRDFQQLLHDKTATEKLFNSLWEQEVIK